MSTNINITVGDNALLDRAKQQQTANRQAQLNRENSTRLEAQATDERTKAQAASGKDANGNPLYGVLTTTPSIDRRPAANRVSTGDVCVFWTDEGEELTVYSGDKSASITVQVPSLTNPIIPKYSTSATPTVSTTVTTGSTSGLFTDINYLIPSDIEVYLYPNRGEKWYVNEGPIPGMPLPPPPEGYWKRYDEGTTPEGDSTVRAQINAYNSTRTDVTERSLLRSEFAGANFSLPLGAASCLYVFYRKYNWSCINARQEYVYTTQTQPLELEARGYMGSYGLTQFSGQDVFDTWALATTATEVERSVETLIDEDEQAFCFLVTKNSVKQVSFPDEIKSWLLSYMVYETTNTVTFAQFSAFYNTATNISPNLYEKPFVGDPTLIGESVFGTGLVPGYYWQQSYKDYVGVDADITPLSVPGIIVPSYPNKRLRSFNHYTVYALASYALNPYNSFMTPWIYSILSRASSFTLNNSSILVGGSVAQVIALLGEAPMRRQITISACEPATICTNDSIAFGYIPNVYNGNDFPSDPPEHKKYNKPLRYPEEPGVYTNLSWNWENPAYCLQQALALGFTSADLTP